MKLYLSSYRIPRPEKLFELIGKNPADTKGAVITNAKERKADQEQEESITGLLSDLAKIGLTNTVQIDLRNDTFEPNGFDYVFAAGGNTFALRQAMMESDFDGKLRAYLNRGGVYVGESAGAIVAGPSLHGFERLDNHFDGAPFEGMGITDVIIVPHNDSSDPRFRGRAPEIQKENQGRKVVPLNDNEDFIVNN